MLYSVCHQADTISRPFDTDSTGFDTDSTHFDTNSGLFDTNSIFAVLVISLKTLSCDATQSVYRPAAHVQQQQDWEPIRKLYLKSLTV